MKPRNKRTELLFATGGIVFIVVLIALLVMTRTMQTQAEDRAASFEARNIQLTAENDVMQVQLEEADTAYQDAQARLEQLASELAQERDEHEATAGTLKTTQKELTELDARHQELKETARLLNVELQALKKTKAVAGTMPSRGGWDKTPSNTHGSAQLVGYDFEATWYNVTGTTRSGRQTQDGVTVAVDPNVIPLGSLLRITFPDGRVYNREAQDTGGAVKGHIVDLYSSASTSELLRRGRTHGVKVEILRRGW
jgi:3D (Asp-Asp-Asp) domain-containing protein